MSVGAAQLVRLGREWWRTLRPSASQAQAIEGHEWAGCEDRCSQLHLRWKCSGRGCEIGSIWCMFVCWIAVCIPVCSICHCC